MPRGNKAGFVAPCAGFPVHGVEPGGSLTLTNAATRAQHAWNEFDPSMPRVATTEPAACAASWCSPVLIGTLGRVDPDGSGSFINA
jgi:hypothetical protein